MDETLLPLHIVEIASFIRRHFADHFFKLFFLDFSHRCLRCLVFVILVSGLPTAFKHLPHFRELSAGRPAVFQCFIHQDFVCFRLTTINPRLRINHAFIPSLTQLLHQLIILLQLQRGPRINVGNDGQGQIEKPFFFCFHFF